MLQGLKVQLQKEMRNTYWKYMENIIFIIEIQEPDKSKIQ